MFVLIGVVCVLEDEVGGEFGEEGNVEVDEDVFGDGGGGDL